MAAKYEQLTREYAPIINDKIAGFESGPSDTIQAFGYELRKLALDKDLAYYETVHYDQVAVDIENRDSEMLIPVKAHQLLAEIARKGWNSQDTQHALAREATRDEKLAKVYITEGRQLVHATSLQPKQQQKLAAAAAALGRLYQL